MEYNFYPFIYPKEKWIYKNKCVIKVEHNLPKDLPPDIRQSLLGIMAESHLCGYVALPKNSVPSDWWGNYDAPGLTSLAIHGNITYCELEGVPDQSKYFEEYKEAMEKVSEESSKDKNPKDPFKYMDQRKKLKEEYNKKLSKSPEGFVVFGFDCNHYMDGDNPELQDVNHVMMLAEQMEQQLLLFAEKYEQYKNADQTPITADIVRKTIMRDIRTQAELNTKMGLGGLLDVLTGKAPEDDLPQ